MGQRKILIVDDDENVAFALEGTLEMLVEPEDEIVVFHAGGPAIDWLRDNRPSLALLDLVLNGVDGFKIVNAILESYPGTPITIITGCVSGSDEVKRAQLLEEETLNIKFASKMSLSKTAKDSWSRLG